MRQSILHPLRTAFRAARAQRSLIQRNASTSTSTASNAAASAADSAKAAAETAANKAKDAQKTVTDQAGRAYENALGGAKKYLGPVGEKAGEALGCEFWYYSVGVGVGLRWAGGEIGGDGCVGGVVGAAGTSTKGNAVV